MIGRSLSDGTDMPVAKVNFMIALARVLHRHALGVACSGGLGVLAQMHQSALWDVPMLVLHGAGAPAENTNKALKIYIN